MLRGVRNIEQGVLEFATGWNCVVGPNGSGKTSLLEGLHCVALGRSHRTGVWHEVVRRGSQAASVHAEFEDDQGFQRRLSLRAGAGERRLEIDGFRPVTLAEAAAICPLVMLSQQTVQVFRQAAADRVAVLDWVLFHVEPGFLATWRRYRQTLRQRNAALRSGADDRPWRDQLAVSGQALHAARARIVPEVADVFRKMAHELATLAVPDLELAAGWPAEMELAAALDRSAALDRKQGFTRVGPHRADLVIRGAALDARRHGSGGQLRLVAYLLRLAQVEILRRHCGRLAVVVFDDIDAELDAESLRGLVTTLDRLDAQVVATTVRPENLASLGIDPQLFHVEQGRFSEGRDRMAR